MEEQLETCENCQDIFSVDELVYDAEGSLYICTECIKARKEFENEDTI